MSDTLTGTADGRRHPRVPDGPGRPLPVRAAAAGARDGRGQTAFPGADLGRQHPVADHRSRGGAGAVRRLARQRRRPPRRLPALERAHALHREQAAAVGVHLRRRGAHPVPPDAVQAVHLQARRGSALRHPRGHRRVHRRDPGRPAARRYRHEARAAGAHQGDQRDARRPIRRPRVLPAPRQRGAGPLRHRGGRPEGGHEPGQVPDQPRRRPRWRTRPRMRCRTWPNGSTPARSA